MCFVSSTSVHKMSEGAYWRHMHNWKADNVRLATLLPTYFM